MASSQEQDARDVLPGIFKQQIDKYIDSLAPQIQPLLSNEIDLFQTKTIDSLEAQVMETFCAIFGKPDQSTTPSYRSTVPESYGQRALAFAPEISVLQSAFSSPVLHGDDQDLRQILEASSEHSVGNSDRGVSNRSSIQSSSRSFLNVAIGAVSEMAGSNHAQQDSTRFGGMLDILTDSIKDTAHNPQEKAREMVPEVKDRVAQFLRQHHSPLAERFTKIALDHIKRWIADNTTYRDLGDGLKDQLGSIVSGFKGLLHQSDSSLFHRSAERQTNETGQEKQGGFSAMISDKLSVGLGKVHRDVRIEFRKILGQIEKSLFESLPDQIQGPLERILGGNPFGPQVTTVHHRGGFGDDLKAKLMNSLCRLVEKIQNSLRDKILSIIAGGHRVLEKSSWRFVQDKVQEKVQTVFPKVKMEVPDDIDDEEGVSVGPPSSYSLRMLKAIHPATCQNEQQHQPQTYPLSFPPPAHPDRTSDDCDRQPRQQQRLVSQHNLSPPFPEPSVSRDMNE